ncbi:MAG: ATP-binding protein [Ilumatobacteraceae bacterium]|jgi:anti-sigma regulatory factor (Ser/Thr protein kinase)
MEAAAGLTSHTRHFAAASESIGAARDLVRDAVAGTQLDHATVTDLQLAVSELVTNAVVHGNGASIAVEVTVAPDVITCAVASDGQTLPEVSSWVAPVDGRSSGRGLSIVRALADAVTVDVDDDRVVVRCTFERR